MDRNFRPNNIEDYLITVRRRDEAGAINPLANTLRFSLTFDFGAFEAKN